MSSVWQAPAPPAPPPPETSLFAQLQSFLGQIALLFLLIAFQSPELAGALIELGIRKVRQTGEFINETVSSLLLADDPPTPRATAASAAAPPSVPLPRQFVLHSKLSRFQQRFDAAASRSPAPASVRDARSML